MSFTINYSEFMFISEYFLNWSLFAEFFTALYRLQLFLTILFLFNFVHIPATYACIKFWKLETICRYLCFSLSILDSNWDAFKKGSLFLERGSVNMLLRGWPCALSKIVPSSLLLYSVCIHNYLISFQFHSYALLKSQLTWEFTFFLFTGS